MEDVRVSEHVKIFDRERRQILCAKCLIPWPCAPKQQEILAQIKLEAKSK